MSLLSARRLMAAHITLVTVAAIVYMTVPAGAPAPWAATGLAGVVAVVTGIRVHRPAQQWRYPQGFLVDVLKIDKSFIGDITRDAQQVALVEDIAFLALPPEPKNRLKTAAAPYLHPGPSPTASPATAPAGLDVNERRGEAIRADLYRKTVRLPIVEVPLTNPADLDAVAAYLWEEGIYVTLAACPLVPRDRMGFRVQLSALNSDDDIDGLNRALTRLSERFPLRLKGAGRP
ncbi:hypothetical protein ACIP4U_39010 [Streptomyces caelestis]|uniref:hypothetical protein n=1 Tax=Streptomyces caelestis TaxID=36816 RepID=UPI003805D909